VIDYKDIDYSYFKGIHYCTVRYKDIEVVAGDRDRSSAIFVAKKMVDRILEKREKPPTLLEKVKMFIGDFF